MLNADKLVRSSVIAVLRNNADLTADIGPDGIVDFVPRSMPLPYVTLSASGASQVLDGDHDLIAVTLGIEIWTEAASRTQMWSLAAALQTAIAEDLINDPGHNGAIVSVSLGLNRTTTNSNGEELQAVLPLRAVVDNTALPVNQT